MCEFDGGVKAHVLEESDSDANESAVEMGVPGLNLVGQLNSIGSLIVFIDNGERLTLPGVMVGSSSILFKTGISFPGAFPVRTQAPNRSDCMRLVLMAE
ncbi:unnamed protein product [Sphagnum jensenii]|uniref:AT-hook motif nuclear-localized protein n=1 Tax=Sphagnum jensenii TaxID=128206 RepID=A0ABP0VHS0_9BRYO